MKNIYHTPLLIIAGSTQKELASQIRYLKVENQILRTKLPARVSVTAKEKNRLVKFASKLGKALNELATIVHPDTLRRWIREVNKSGEKGKKAASLKKSRRRNEYPLRFQTVASPCLDGGWRHLELLGDLGKSQFAFLTQTRSRLSSFVRGRPRRRTTIR
jgi:putative transposase